MTDTSAPQRISGFPGLRILRRSLSLGQRVAYLYQHYGALKLLARSLDDGLTVESRPERPIIVIGMHRSGTSLLAQQLGDLGVNMGMWQGRNTNESMFFRHRNQLLLTLAHASWDNPDAFLRAIGNPDWLRAFARVAARDLGTLRTLNFLPPQSIRRFAPAVNPNWGFKDPRTTLTLPVWNVIFPNSLVINIVRNGYAVASSLYRRGKKQLQNRIPSSLVSLDPSMGIELWSEYVLTAKNCCATLPPARYLEIRYETLVHSPDEVLRTIASFICLEPGSKQLETASARIIKNDQAVVDNLSVSASTKEALELFGYL